MLLQVFTVLMHVSSFCTSAASPGARIRETVDAGSSDAAHRFGVQGVSPTSVRHSSGRSAETLPRSLDFSSRSHPVASPDHAGHPSRLSGRSDTARESPVRLSSSAAFSLPRARGMHCHSGTLLRVGSRGRDPARHRGRAVEHLLSRREEEHDEGPRLFGGVPREAGHTVTHRGQKAEHSCVSRDSVLRTQGKKNQSHRVGSDSAISLSARVRV